LSAGSGKRDDARLDIVSCSTAVEEVDVPHFAGLDGQGNPVFINEHFSYPYVFYGKDLQVEVVFKRVLYGDGRERLVVVPNGSHGVDYLVSLFRPDQERLGPRVCPVDNPFSVRERWPEYKAIFRPNESESRPGRRLSPELACLRELTRAPFTSNILDDERRLVSQYIREKSNQVLVFRNGDDEVFAKPYEYRYSPGRVARVRKRMRDDVKPRLKHEKYFLFVTLTVSTRRFKSQYEAYDYVSSKFNSLMSSIRKLVKKKFNRCVEFVRSYEVQENGIGYHVHVLLVGVSFINADWLRKIWGETNKRSVDLKPVRNWKQAYNYVLKYNLKDVEADETGENLSISQVVNLAVGARAYGVSRGFSSSLGNRQHNSNRDASEKWVFLGVMDLGLYNKLGFRDLLAFFGCGPP